MLIKQTLALIGLGIIIPFVLILVPFTLVITAITQLLIHITDTVTKFGGFDK